jgi:outer membrane protein TolC
MNGLIDYLPVLNQLQTLQQLELDQVSGQQALISYRIALCKALGGTWIKRPSGSS